MARQLSGSHSMHLSLLPSFELRRGQVPLSLPRRSQRLLAFLAVAHESVARRRIIAQLWPDLVPSRGLATLRSALSELQTACAIRLVAPRGESLSAVDTLDTDYDCVLDLTRRLAHGDVDITSIDVDETIASMRRDLLVDWDDDWLVIEREAWRERRLYGLDALARFLLDGGRYQEAVMAALGSIAEDHLREPSHELMIASYIGAGRNDAATRAFDLYKRRLASELGARPPDRLRALISTISIGET